MCIRDRSNSIGESRSGSGNQRRDVPAGNAQRDENRRNRNNGNNQVNENYDWIPFSDNPVSYTHLDVYKRQQLPRTIETLLYLFYSDSLAVSLVPTAVLSLHCHYLLVVVSLKKCHNIQTYTIYAGLLGVLCNCFQINFTLTLVEII